MGYQFPEARSHSCGAPENHFFLVKCILCIRNIKYVYTWGSRWIAAKQLQIICHFIYTSWNNESLVFLLLPFPFFPFCTWDAGFRYFLHGAGLPKQPAVAKSVSMHKRCSNLRMYTAYMMAWVKTLPSTGQIQLPMDWTKAVLSCLGIQRIKKKCWAGESGGSTQGPEWKSFFFFSFSLSCFCCFSAINLKGPLCRI